MNTTLFYNGEFTDLSGEEFRALMFQFPIFRRRLWFTKQRRLNLPDLHSCFIFGVESRLAP